jgi:hypothetical protein
MAICGDRYDVDFTAAGVVVDEQGLPVEGASVTVNPPGLATTTNVGGHFRLHTSLPEIERKGQLALKVGKREFNNETVKIDGYETQMRIELKREKGWPSTP